MHLITRTDCDLSVLFNGKPSQSAVAHKPMAGAVLVCLILASCGDKQVPPVASVDSDYAPKVVKTNQADPVVRYSQGRFSNPGQQLGVRVGKVPAATPEERTKAKYLTERLKSQLGNRKIEEEVRASAAAFETDAVIEVAKSLLDSPHADTRAAALNLLAGSDSEEAIALLMGAFGDLDVDVRQLAFQSAAILPPELLESGLLSGMDDADMGVRQAAFQAATAQAGPTADRAVEKGMSSRNPDITLTALTHLEVSMQKTEVPTVINALTHSNPQVRELATEILGTLTYQTFAAAQQAKQWWQENQHHFDQDLVVTNPESYPAFNLNR
jgi:HEAT repeat protein